MSDDLVSDDLTSNAWAIAADLAAEVDRFNAALSEARAEGEGMMATTAAEFGELSVKLAESALIAREKGDEVNALFFAVKAAETLALAKALGWKPRPYPEADR